MPKDTALSLARKLSQIYYHKQLILSCAESCTGGGLCQIITSLPNSSLIFDRGFITYSNASKIQQLHVSEETLSTHGAVSSQTAQAMALGALVNSNADTAISITGIAGPRGGTHNKPVGTVWIGLAQRKQAPQTQHFHFTGGRKSIQDQAILHALKYLLLNTNI